MNEKTFQRCMQKYNGTTSIKWSELSEEFPEYGDGESLRQAFKAERNRRGISPKGSPVFSKNNSHDISDYISEHEHTETKEDGSSTIKMVADSTVEEDFLKTIFYTKNKTDEDMLMFHGFDVDKWEIVSVRNNGWTMPAGNEQYYYCYQSRISVKPKQYRVTPEFIEEYFKSLLDKLSKKLPEFQPSPNTAYDEDGVVIEINMADFHLGKISYDGKRNFSGDIVDAMHDIYEQIKHKKIKQILLVNLGDISQYDSSGKKATTKGTLVDATDDTPQELFDIILNLLIYIVMLFSQLAPVEVISVFGNHDENLTYYLFKTLQIYFMHDKNIKFDVVHEAHKARLIGITLVGYTHGSANKGRIETNLLQVLFRELWGKAKQAEIHVGHYHSEKHEEKGGLTLRYLPSPSTTDKWHYDNLFVGAKRAVTAFEYHMTKGFRSYMMAVIE